MTEPYELGQYFTTNTELREKVYSFILNKPSRILEPSIGRGDLINYVCEKDNSIKFDMYEIDDTINILNKYISRDKVIFGDFLEQPIQTKYKTIIGNPPYKRMKTKTGNLYIDFISRCYDLPMTHWQCWEHDSKCGVCPFLLQEVTEEMERING